MKRIGVYTRPAPDGTTIVGYGWTDKRGQYRQLEFCLLYPGDPAFCAEQLQSFTTAIRERATE